MIRNSVRLLGVVAIAAWSGACSDMAGERPADAPISPDSRAAPDAAIAMADAPPSPVADALMTATNLPPVFGSALMEVTYTGAPIDVTAEATDPDGDPIVSYRWRVKGHPEDSSATVSSSSATVHFVADVDGPYVLEVIASDGRADSNPFEVSVTSYHPLAPLGHRVIAAEMSRSLSRIVMIEDGPASLHIYDPVAKSEVAVPLSATPTSVSVSPDGHFAAVGHDASFSYVDLVDAEVVKVYALTVPVLNLVLAGNGYVYVFPSSNPPSNPFPALHMVDLQTGFESQTGAFFFLYATVGRLHPDGDRIYAADVGVSPSIVADYGIAAPANPTSHTGPPMGDYFFCDDLWLTEDGSRLITRCGEILRATSDATTDMAYTGMLAAFSGLEHIQDISDSKAAGKLVVARAADMFDDPNGDEMLFIYGDQDLDLEKQLPLGAFIVSGKAYPARGRFVFADPDGAHYHVFVEADPSAGLVADYAVATYAF